VYGVAQPTLGGMKNVIHAVHSDCKELTNLIWINLREEPLIYINGVPYVLRDQYLTLRNTKTFSGITPARLEIIESNLKEDIQKEIVRYEDKILLHEESEDAKIVPVWEDCTPSCVNTFKEVMSIVHKEESNEQLSQPESVENLHLEYYRVPITAETPPDLVDIDLLITILSRVDMSETAIVLNCQIGLGRSTTGTGMVFFYPNKSHSRIKG
jgi:hypothetical protein